MCENNGKNVFDIANNFLFYLATFPIEIAYKEYKITIKLCIRFIIDI